MQTDDTTLDALIDAHAAWQGLTIDPARRPAIRQSLVALAGAIDAVATVELPDEAEVGPRFEP
jgi:Protein of unknown function (DUF4089)